MTPSLTDPRSTLHLALARTDRALFLVTACLAATLVWLAPRPPMVDLPQHAAQVALWRDLLRGVSPWTDLVRINLLTPYLLGYGLMLPLSFVLPLAAAAQVVLTLAYAGFVAGCVVLRRSFGGDRRLDWLFLFGFFGFAWQWGFVTFLAAAPLGLFFLALAQRHARTPTWRSGFGLVALGIVLLFSHGLIFLMAVALGGLLAGWHLLHRRFQDAIIAGLPFAVLAGVVLLFRLATRDAEGAQQFDNWIFGVPLWLRPAAILAYVNGMDWPEPAVAIVTVLLLAAPWVLGARLGRTGGPVLLAGLAVILLGVPDYVAQTAYVFNRFALFLLPFYALAFRRPVEVSAARHLIVTALLAGACWITLGRAAQRIVALGTESRSFETVLAAAEPGRRALAMIADRSSQAADNKQVYRHWAAWYQADKHGFVDFNFAVFHPQVVRFRSDRRPAVTREWGWTPQASDGRASRDIYDYVFVRGSADDVAGVRRAIPCLLTTVAADGPWTLLGRGACPSP